MHRLCRELAAKLDAEKEIVSNPHLVEEQSSEPEADAAADATAVTASKDGTDYEQQVGKLDQVLTWLWRVHGVDYYAGVEVAEPDAQQRTGARPTLRCPRPEEGEQVSTTSSITLRICGLEGVIDYLERG